MESRELLLRLLYRAFVDIRQASTEGNSRAVGAVSTLFHNIPLAMIRSDADVVVNGLRERAQTLGMSSWIQAALDDIARNND